MDLVADTNIVVAAIVRKGPTRYLLFNGTMRTFTPDFFFSELEEHEAEFAGKSRLPYEQYRHSVRLVLNQIEWIPHEIYSKFKVEAKAITPDPDDWPFFALALQKKCALWSNDRRLKNQQHVPVYSTKEILEMLP